MPNMGWNFYTLLGLSRHTIDALDLLHDNVPRSVDLALLQSNKVPQH